MQLHNVFVLLLVGVTLAQGGYHKVRPPPPNLPPPKLHYGPKPPSHYYSKPPPFIPWRPPGPPRNPIRPPTRPYYAKPTPPPFPPSSWKTHNSFRPPVVKESFYSAPLTPDYSLHFAKDDDKGPIHTIPAPNLSPADKPHDFPESPSHGSALEAVLKHGQTVHSHSGGSYQVTEDPSAYKPYSGSPSYFAPDPDPSLPTIEVTKAQDPFSIPSNGVRPLDVYQQELADQAQSYQQNTQLSYADGAANSLSSQELFTLLNGYSQHGQQLVGIQQMHQQPLMTPELYQQYLLAATGGQQAPATSYQQQQHGVLYHQQHYQQQLHRQQQQPQEAQISQNFHPQFENFNYNEQTQESAYGSDSFPSASSISVGVKRAVPKDFNYGSINSLPSDYKGRKNEYLGKNEGDVKDEEVLSNQVDYEDEKPTEVSVKDKVPLNLLNAGHYTTLPNKQTAETLATLAAAGNVNNQIMKSPYQNEQENEVKQSNENRNNSTEGIPQDYERPTPDSKPKETNGDNKESSADNEYADEEILDPSDKDQMSTSPMQNSMAMYQTTFYNNMRAKETQTEEQNYEDTESDYTQEEEKEIRSNLGSRSSTTERTANYNAHHKLPYGAKLRPKRV